MMEIDWKYDDIKNNIEIDDIVTFEFNGKYYTGVIYNMGVEYINVLNHGKIYTLAFSKIIARASFDDVIRPAKPKRKFPDGALSWDEIKKMSRDKDYMWTHLWVKFDNDANNCPAILDTDGYDNIVIVWCASDDKEWLREDGYGKDYVCYLNKPDED